MFARSEFQRIYGQLTGFDAEDRRQSAYDANAEFMSSLGLDPEAVLGERPVHVDVDNAGE